MTSPNQMVDKLDQMIVEDLDIEEYQDFEEHEEDE
jgi:hypothetical protein